MNGENKILKRQSGALLKRLFFHRCFSVGKLIRNPEPMFASHLIFLFAKLPKHSELLTTFRHFFFQLSGTSEASCHRNISAIT